MMAILITTIILKSTLPIKFLLRKSFEYIENSLE